MDNSIDNLCLNNNVCIPDLNFNFKSFEDFANTLYVPDYSKNPCEFCSKSSNCNTQKLCDNCTDRTTCNQSKIFTSCYETESFSKYFQIIEESASKIQNLLNNPIPFFALTENDIVSDASPSFDFDELITLDEDAIVYANVIAKLTQLY